MKKYDLILLGLYVTILIVIIGIVLSVEKQESQAKMEVKSYMEALYKKSVNTVTVKDTPLHLTLVRGDLSRQGFVLSGYMYVRNADFFKVQGDTLVITGKKEAVSRLTLHLASDVKIDTVVNAPHVKMESFNVK